MVPYSNDQPEPERDQAGGESPEPPGNRLLQALLAFKHYFNRLIRLYYSGSVPHRNLPEQNAAILYSLKAR